MSTQVDSKYIVRKTRVVEDGNFEFMIQEGEIFRGDECGDECKVEWERPRQRTIEVFEERIDCNGGNYSGWDKATSMYLRYEGSVEENEHCFRILEIVKPKAKSKAKSKAKPVALVKNSEKPSVEPIDPPKTNLNLKGKLVVKNQIMTTVAQIKNIHQYIETFLTEHGSEEMVEMWQDEQNMSEFSKLLKKATKTTKTTKKTKDPNKPKRGKSAYLFFCAANRSEVKDELGESAKATEVTSKLGEKWQILKVSEKAADKKILNGFEEEAAVDKARYDDDMKGYEVPSDEELEKGAKKKRKSKKKDPNAPKRGKSAYIFFCADKRAEVKEEMGEMGDDVKATEVTSRLGELWNELKEDDDRADEMKVYVAQAAEDKARYLAAMEEYVPEDSDETEDKKEDKKPAPTVKGKTKAKVSAKAKVTTKVTGKKINGYIYFCQEHRADVKIENPDMKASDVTKELASMWSGLGEDAKKEWKEAVGAQE
jgi:hypothetical protein